MRNEFLTALGTLARPSGLARLQEYLAQSDSALSPEEVAELYELIQSELAETPELADTPLRVGPTPFGGGAYFPRSGLVSVKRPVATAIAHELGHAKSVGASGPTYRDIQTASREVSRLTNNLLYALPIAAMLPLLLRLSALKTYRKFGPMALNALTGVTLAANLPTLVEEAIASADAVRHVPDKLEATKEMAKTMGAYGAKAAIPIAAYQIAKRFVR
jgi:hypothetical protein